MRSKASLQKPKLEGTTNKTFRLPNGILEVLSADAEENGRTVTDLLVSILTRYVDFDREAKKFGFVTISRNTFRALLDSLPDEKVQEVALAQSVVIEEFVNFWFRKRDIDSVLATMDIVSRYQKVFEYTVSRNDREMTITIRSDFGRKFIRFIGMAWERGMALTLGVTPRVEEAEHQLTFVLPISETRSPLTDLAT